MAQITKSIRMAHGFAADLVPAEVLKSIDQSELYDRLIYAGQLVRKSQAATDVTIRRGYAKLAQQVMLAQPRSETERQVGVLVAKAAGAGNTRQADVIRAEAQRLQELHPAAPRRSESVAVTKAKAESEIANMILVYDSAGNAVGVISPENVTKIGQPGASEVEKARAGKGRRRPGSPAGRR